MSVIADLITEELQKKSGNSITIGDYFENTDFDVTATEEEMRRIANSKTFREKLLRVGRNDFGYEEGFKKLANVTTYGNSRVSFPSIKSRYLDPLAETLRLEYVEMIFETQDNRDFFFYISPGGRSFSWIMPNCFKAYEIRYETDHLRAKKRGGVDSLENLAFFTANTNRMMKNQLLIDEFLDLYCPITELCQRITDNLKRREVFFASSEWSSFKQTLCDFEQGI